MMNQRHLFTTHCFAFVILVYCVCVGGGGGDNIWPHLNDAFKIKMYNAEIVVIGQNMVNTS